MTDGFANEFTALLNGAIDNDDTSVAFDNAVGSQPEFLPFRILIQDSETDKTNREYMLVTAGSSSPWTVTRGIEGSAGVAHADNSFIAHVLTAGGLEVSDQDEFIGPYHPYNADTSSLALTANLAYFQRFVPRGTRTVSNVRFRVVTQAGNLDFGIYDEDLDRLGSTGSFSCPAASGENNQNLTGSVTLRRGRVYYLAAVASSGTYRTCGIVRAGGVLLPAGANSRLVGQQSSALPLPSTATVSWEPGSTTPRPSMLFV